MKTAQYKGRKYRLLFKGKTKIGQKAKLGFFGDESKEFWVDADKIEEVASTRGKGFGRRTCPYCGDSDCPGVDDPRACEQN